MVKKNIFIAGGSGNLGSHIYNFNSPNFNLTSTYYKNKFFKNFKNYIKVDLNKKSQIIKIIKKKKIDIIINVSALTDIVFCEKNKKNCLKVNYYQTKTLADIAKKFNIKLIHISTDAVYDDKNFDPPFKETNSLSSVNYYQYCKVRSELYIEKKLEQYLIIRTNPFGLNNHTNSIYWLFDNANKNKKIYAFYDVIFNPIFSGDLAKYIFFLIKKNINGKINIGTIKSINKYDLAKSILKKFKIKKKVNKISIKNFSSFKRKLNTTMDLSKLERIVGKSNMLNINQSINNFYNYEKKISK